MLIPTPYLCCFLLPRLQHAKQFFLAFPCHSVVIVSRLVFVTCFGAVSSVLFCLAFFCHPKANREAKALLFMRLTAAHMAIVLMFPSWQEE